MNFQTGSVSGNQYNMATLFTLAVLLFFAYTIVRLTFALASLIPAVLGIALVLWIVFYWPVEYTLVTLFLILLVVSRAD